MPSYTALPDPVLRRVLAGMLLTHYRSAHPEPRRSKLQVVQDVPIEAHGYSSLADVAIVDRQNGKVIAFFQILTPGQALSDFAAKLDVLRRYTKLYSSPDYPLELGIALPESLETDSIKKLAGSDFHLVTYPD